MIKIISYIILKTLSILKIHEFLSWVFGDIEKTTWLERKVNLITHDVTAWLTNNYNTHIAQYLKR